VRATGGFESNRREGLARRTLRCYHNIYIYSDSTVEDTYTSGHFTGQNPVPVSGGTTLVRHNGQSYKVGGSGTAGYSATGFTIDSFTLQERLGSANHL